MNHHKTFIQNASIAAVLGGLLIGTSGCAPEPKLGSDASRAVIYESVEALAQDSSVVVVGTPVSQTEVRDLDDVTDFTVTTFEISEVVQQNTDASPPAPGSTVEIRQLGTAAYDPIPAPILTVGTSYLLFLTPSGLDGEQASQFYVTGGNAGLYSAPTDSAVRGTPTFTQVSAEEGEELPVTIKPSELSK